MNNFLNEFKTVFIAKNTLLLRKTYFYYFLVIFIVVCRLNFASMHGLRLFYLGSLYENIPQTHENKVGILFADYATRLSPFDAEGWIILSDSLRQAGDMAGAVHAYQKAINLKPTRPKLRSLLAELSKKLQKDSKDVEIFDPSVQESP